MYIKKMKKRKNFEKNIIKNNMNNFFKIKNKFNWKYFHLKEDYDQIFYL